MTLHARLAVGLPPTANVSAIRPLRFASETYTSNLRVHSLSSNPSLNFPSTNWQSEGCGSKVRARSIGPISILAPVYRQRMISVSHGELITPGRSRLILKRNFRDHYQGRIPC